MNRACLYQIGQEIIKNYKVTKAKPLSALQAVLYEIKHTLSGAKIMHIANDDKENVFCLNFMTLPSSNDGVAHILEHTVLCGSKKFPVKDPFFYMIRRSLNTFMNAMTGSDFTCYPAASQVEKDFYNLLDVYLDAVFNPLLKELSFLQEGHRLEFKKIDDTSSDLTFQGIVYNEMKGALNSADARLWHTILKHLMPDLPYRFNSGGEPQEIPDLTYESFINFHKKFYHPSRCLFYFYGNIPIEKHLKFIDNKILSHAEKLSPLPSMPKQPRFSKPISIIGSYPTSEKDLSHKAIISFSWLTTEVKNQEDVLALLLLDSILMDTDASPLKYALMQSNLCRACDAFIDIETSEIPFCIICRGSEEKHAQELENIIFKTLNHIYQSGIDPKLIDSTLHQLEFSRLEITGDHYPFGLSLFFRSGLALMHGCPPENALIVHELFEDLLEKLKNPNYLLDILKKYFLDNKHFLRLIMLPNTELEKEEIDQEKEKLKEIKDQLTEEEKKAIVTKSKQLLAFQQTPSLENIETLPKIHIEDVPKENIHYHLDEYSFDSFKAFHHECFTNHIVYVDIISDLPKLSQEDLFTARLFTYLATGLGTKNLSYIEQQKRLHAETGGVHFSLATHSLFSSPDAMSPALHLRGKALSRKVLSLFLIFKDLLTQVRFDEKDRIKELILKLHTHKQNKLLSNSMSYAIDLALAHNSKTTKLHHLWHGLPYYKFIEDLAKNIDQKLDAVIEKLKKIQNLLFHHNNLHIVISCDQTDFNKIKHECFPVIERLKKSLFKPWHFDYVIDDFPSHAKIIPSPVAFTCKAFQTIYSPHQDVANLCLASSLFDHKILHKDIREIGGAYGAGSLFNAVSGNFYMYSYRDPNLKTTLTAFEKAIQTIASGQFDHNDLEEAKLSLIQSLDDPVSPGSRASLAYAQKRENRTKIFRQKFREDVLSAKPEAVINAVKNHLIDFSTKAKVITFAGKDLVTKENTKLDNQLPLYEI